MSNQSTSCKGILLAVMLAVVPGIETADRSYRELARAGRTTEIAPGIHTDRLSARELRIWKKIEAIVLAQESPGRYAHPVLYGLWQWAGTSGHVIYIQLVDPKSRWDNQAGRFKIEKADPYGRKHVAVIELCLPVIDEALVRRRVGAGNGFIQYDGLGREERYAEVLAHELAHAVWTLSDQDRTRLVDDLDREIESFGRRRRALGRRAWGEEMRQHLQRVESWKETIEKPAKMAEEEVWRELRSGRIRGSATATPVSRAEFKRSEP